MRVLFLVVAFVCGAYATVSTVSDEYSETCTSYCICDSVDGLNRANCSSHNLIDANIGLSELVQIMDLSNNLINSLDETSFRHMRHLRMLSIASNSIHYMELNTFKHQSRLQNLSLANNRLQWLDQRIVERAVSLEMLDVSGNMIEVFRQDAPLLSSRSLRELRLNRNRIAFVSSTMLGELPNLQRLDLSDNLLIMLQTASFVHNGRLAVLNVVNNPFNCDENMRATLVKMKLRRVQVINWDCTIVPPRSRNHSQMFERMVMQTSTTDLVAKPTKMPSATTEINLRSVWRPIIDESDETERRLTCPDNDTTDECQLLKACANQLAALRDHDQRKQEKRNTKPLDVKPVLYSGILIGTVIGGCVMYGLMLMRECCRSKRRRSRDQHRLRRTYVIRGQRDYDPDPEHIDTPIMEHIPMMISDAVHQQQPPPLPPSAMQAPPSRRRAPRHRRPHTVQPEPRLGRRKTLYNLLFDRPAHRRYVRSISQSTSNLVRRLSQSRLFLNLNAAPAMTDEVAATNAGVEGPRLVSSSSFDDDGGGLSDVTVYYPREEMTVGTFTPQDRPETPPPMYGDVVKK